MHVLAARLGKLGKTAEEELIRYALSRFSDKCTSTSPKSLGIKAEPTHVIFSVCGVLMSLAELWQVFFTLGWPSEAGD